MSNLIQIKRSLNNATVPDLNPGELAFTHGGDILYVGNPDAANTTVKNIRIGGYQTPGTLRANQALVANSTSGIDKLITTALSTQVITLPGSSPSGANGAQGYVLTSNGDSNAFWQSISSLGVDTTGNYSWSGKHTFAANVNVTAAQINVAKLVTGTNGYNVAGDVTVGGVTVNTTIIGIGNTTVKSYINSSSIGVGGNYGTDIAGIGGGIINTTAIAFANSIQGSSLTRVQLAIGNVAATDSIGGMTANNGVILIGNSSVRSQINSTAFTGTANNTLFVGSTAAADVVNTTSLATALGAYASQSYVDTSSSNAYTWAMANTLTRNGTYTGNNVFSGANISFTSVGGEINFKANNVIYAKDKSKILFGNVDVADSSMAISGNLTSGLNGFKIHGMAIAMGGSGDGSGGVTEYAPLGNMTTGGANVFFVNTQILQIGKMINASNGTYTNVIGGTIILNSSDGARATINSTSYSGTIASASNALQLGGIDASNYIQVGDSKTLSGNLYFTGANNQLNTVRIQTLNGAGAGDKTTIAAANLVISSTNVAMDSANVSIRNLSISGNLSVSGTLTSIDTQNLIVKDGTIKLAEDQANTSAFTDAIDFGFYGTYGNTNIGNTFYSGLVRDHLTSTTTSSLWRLFSTDVEPTGTTDFTVAGSKMGTLKAYLQTNGSFVANSTVVNITANATVSSAIIANTLTLTSALGANSGGTGSTVTNPGDMIIGSATTGGSISAVIIGGTTGQFTCSAATLAVNDLVTISGSYGGGGSITGYADPTTYRVSAVTGTPTNITGFTLKTLSNTALTTTLGTPTGLTYSTRWNNGSYEKLALGNAGYVLQSNGTALKYDILDGGTF